MPHPYRLPPDGRLPIRQSYSVGQVAAALGVSIRTVQKCIDSGVIRGFRLPSSWRADRRVAHESLCRYVVEHPEMGVDLNSLFGRDDWDRPANVLLSDQASSWKVHPKPESEEGIA